MFGHGLGAFEPAYAPHRADHRWLMDHTIMPVPWNAAGMAHNTILQALIETGAIGLGLAGVFLYFALKTRIPPAVWVAIPICLIGFPEQNPATAILLACAVGVACPSR